MDILAWKLLSLSELQLMLFGIALLLIGFCLGLFLRRKTTMSLRRVSYFLLTVGVVLAINTSTYLWAYLPEALNRNLLGPLILLIFSVTLVGGVVIGAAAAARSVSAYGHARKGWLAMVPFANLILAFAPPQTPVADRSLLAKALDVAAVVTGILVYALGTVAGRHAENFVIERTAAAYGDPATANAIIDLRLAAGDLPAILQETASATQSGQIDDWTVLDTTIAEGNVLRFAYTLDAAADAPGDDFGGYLTKNACSDPYFAKVMNAGARLEHTYQTADHSQTFRFMIEKDDCTL